MAYVAGNWDVFMSFKDRDENVRGMSIFLDTALTYTNLITDGELEDLVAAAAALSDANLQSYILSQRAVDATLESGVPAETSDVERKGSFVFRAANGAIMKIEVPSIKNSLVTDGSNIIPVTGVVATFVNAMTTTGIFASNPITYLGSALTALKPPARKIHRKSSEG